MKKLLSVSFTILLLSGCYKSDWESAKTENNQLKYRINQLETEVMKLKETAQYHFQQGQDKLFAKKYSEAIIYFKTVINKYPNDPLATNSKRALAIAQEQESYEIQQKKEAESMAAISKEKEIAESGEPIEYSKFFAKKGSGGLIVGKRYRFRACLAISNNCLTEETISKNVLKSQRICVADMRYFDNKSEHEKWLEGGNDYCGYIVAGLVIGNGSIISIFRLH
jgi:hypothetical protein